MTISSAPARNFKGTSFLTSMLYICIIQIIKMSGSREQAVRGLEEIDNEEDVDLRIKRIQQMQETASEELSLVHRQC